MKKNLLLAMIVVIMSVILCGCCSHEWEEATCTEPETCSLCGETQGEALGHEDAEYEDWEIDAEKLVYYKEKYCSKCEEYYDRVDGEDVTSFVNNGRLMISASEFADRFDASVMNGYKFYSKETYNEDMYFYDDNNIIFFEIQNEEDNDKTVGMYSFSKEGGGSLPKYNQYSSGEATGINILIDNESVGSAIIFATIQAIDPALDYDGAADLGQSIVDNFGDMKGITKNSIKYVLYKDGGHPYLLVEFL